MGNTAQKCQQCGREIYFDGICVSCQTENERNRILAFSQEEIDAAVREICEEIEENGKLDEQEQMFINLVNYRDINTAEIARTAFEQKLFRPYEIYKNAPDNIVREMLDMLMQDELETIFVSNLMMCLAVHGSEEVFQAFLELEKHPRKWRENLYVGPSVYATGGGWTFDSNGMFTKTVFDKCYPMVKGTPEKKQHSPVKIGVKADGNCPHCGCRLVNLMEIDGNDSRLDFLEIDGVIKAKCCPNCFPFSGGDFCRYSEHGESEIIWGERMFSMDDHLKEDGIEELTSNSYVLGDAPVPPRYAADWEGGSSVGGFGFWIQDCDIKLCPDCGKPMKYLAQIQWDTIMDYMEGNAYIEICRDCKILALLHQQT